MRLRAIDIMDDCPLCDLQKKTHWYIETPWVIVCDCLTCEKPLAVLKRHTMTPTKQEISKMESALAGIANAVYGQNEWRLRREQRNIPDHIHFHAEPKLGS